MPVWASLRKLPRLFVFSEPPIVTRFFRLNILERKTCNSNNKNRFLVLPDPKYLLAWDHMNFFYLSKIYSLIYTRLFGNLKTRILKGISIRSKVGKQTAQAIECVRLSSSNSQFQNKRATKGFILIRHNRYQIYFCLQLSSSIASFVWKSAHFELRSYGDAWHNTKIASVEKYTLISWYLAILGVKVSGKVLL